MNKTKDDLLHEMDALTSQVGQLQTKLRDQEAQHLAAITISQDLAEVKALRADRDHFKARAEDAAYNLRFAKEAQETAEEKLKTAMTKLAVYERIFPDSEVDGRRMRMPFPWGYQR